LLGLFYILPRHKVFFAKIYFAYAYVVLSVLLGNSFQCELANKHLAIKVPTQTAVGQICDAYIRGLTGILGAIQEHTAAHGNIREFTGRYENTREHTGI
jgi:hypothetical protein